MVRIGIDVGGTSISAGITDENARIIAKGSEPSLVSDGRQAVCANIRKSVFSLLERERLKISDVLSIGMGFPGSADVQTLTVCSSSNMRCTDGINMREIFHDIPDGVGMFLDNDANAAAWGEYLYCGKKSDLTMLTIGTGIGCGMVIDGRIYRGFNGLAGEAGHMVVEKDGRLCGCGRRGCFERYASVSGLALTAREMMEENPKSLLWQMCGGKTDRLNGQMIFQALEQGDVTAQKAVESFTEYLAEGISNIIMLIQPERLVLSGAVTKQGDIILKPLRQKYGERMYKTKNGHTKIEISECADIGVIGAAMLYADAQTERGVFNNDRSGQR